MMKGMSIRVIPSDWPATTTVVRIVVAAKPQTRIEGRFNACPPYMNNPEIVVITGASAGVGRATAQAFGKRRARVGLIARGRAGLEAAKREIESSGGEAIVLPLDVSDHQAVEQAAGEVEKTFGPID